VAFSGSLMSVYVTADGRRGWAVGGNGAIVATEDGGGHWTPQNSGTHNPLAGVQFAGVRRHGGLRRILGAAARPPKISRALSSPRTDAAAGPWVDHTSRDGFELILPRLPDPLGVGVAHPLDCRLQSRAGYSP
jgi:hypothetical protein